MITIVLTNRNRNLDIVKKCLESLHNQSDQEFEWFLVDYGSEASYLKSLTQLVKAYSKIQYITCPTNGQLWSKCRAINIALKKAQNPYFVVGDIDLIFHPDYITNLKQLANPSQVHYFQYGFLNEIESNQSKDFDLYKVDFKGQEEVTGNTMFPTRVLKEINGFDEFYQGWGAEDTDAHIRMKNYGLQLCFFNKRILVKHQWHGKAYRSKKSTHPYHSQLESINHKYLEQTVKLNRTVVNTKMKWGKVTIEKDYLALQKPNVFLKIENTHSSLSALLAQLQHDNSGVLNVEIVQVSKTQYWKNKLKKYLGKKYIEITPMERVNNNLLEEIIKTYRNKPYNYIFDRVKNRIVLTINLTA